MPSAWAFFTAGSTASASHASTTSTLAPRVTRSSMLAACFSFEPAASALMYLPPAFSIAAFIAASSRFQRSSWKFDHETPTVWAAAMRAAARTPTVTSNSVQLRPKDVVMRASPDRAWLRLWNLAIDCGRRSPSVSSLVIENYQEAHDATSQMGDSQHVRIRARQGAAGVA